MSETATVTRSRFKDRKHEKLLKSSPVTIVLTFGKFQTHQCQNNRHLRTVLSQISSVMGVRILLGPSSPIIDVQNAASRTELPWITFLDQETRSFNANAARKLLSHYRLMFPRKALSFKIQILSSSRARVGR